VREEILSDNEGLGTSRLSARPDIAHTGLLLDGGHSSRCSSSDGDGGDGANGGEGGDGGEEVNEEEEGKEEMELEEAIGEFVGHGGSSSSNDSGTDSDGSDALSVGEEEEEGEEDEAEEDEEEETQSGRGDEGGDNDGEGLGWSVMESIGEETETGLQLREGERLSDSERSDTSRPTARPDIALTGLLRSGGNSSTDYTRIFSNDYFHFNQNNQNFDYF